MIFTKKKHTSMKTIRTLTLSTLLAFSMLPSCTTPSAKPAECCIKDSKLLDASGQQMDGCCVMHNGKMMTMTGGKLVVMKKNMTMSDGTVCMVDGECVMKGGEKHKLSEGEIISPAGKLFQVRGLSVPGSHY